MPTIKKVLTSKFFLFAALLLIIWLGIVSVKAFYRKYQLDQEISVLKVEINKLGNKDSELSQLIKYFENQDFLEKEAKEKLNLKREGENVVMVPEAAISQNLSLADEPTAGASEQALAESKTENNLIKWWKYLFGR